MNTRSDRMRPARRTIVTALASSVVAACAPRSRDQSVLTFWAMGREGEVVTDLLAAFEAENPGVRVVTQTLPWTAAHERLLTSFVGDALPDVMQLGNTWIPEFAALGAIEAIDARLTSSRDIDSSDYFEGIWATNIHAQRLYGIPWYVDTRVLFYRRDLLNQAGIAAPPRDWRGWRTALEAVKRAAGAGNYGILLPLNEYEPMIALALQQAEPMLRDRNTRGNFESEGFKRVLRFYLDLFADGLAPPATNTQISNVYNEFNRGYFSFYISGPWNIGEFKRRLPADRQDIWMTAPLPGPDGPGASVAGGSSLVISSRSRRKDLAWKLIEYLSRPAVQARFHAITGDLPPRRSAWRAPGLANDPYARAFADQLERARPSPRVPEWERIAEEIRIVGEHMVQGEYDVAGAAATLNARVDHILEKRRWMVEQGRAA